MDVWKIETELPYFVFADTGDYTFVHDYLKGRFPTLREAADYARQLHPVAENLAIINVTSGEIVCATYADEEVRLR